MKVGDLVYIETANALCYDDGRCFGITSFEAEIGICINERSSMIDVTDPPDALVLVNDGLYGISPTDAEVVNECR